MALGVGIDYNYTPVVTWSHVVRKWKRKSTYDAKRIIVLLEIQKYLGTQIKHKKEHRIVFIVSQSRIK